MHDDSVLVAVDDATRRPAICTCGRFMAVVEADDAMWLECPTYVQPSRLPSVVASFVRSILHDRQFVVEIPEALRRPARPVSVVEPTGVTRRVTTARA